MPDVADLLELLRPPELTPQLEFVVNVGIAITAALAGGILATRLGLPAVVGYVLAGVAIGPFTPGFVGDPERIGALAEIGIVLLLFALGVQMSVADLARVGPVATLGGVGQIAASTVLGALVAAAIGAGPIEALVVGAALAISSTLVAVKLLAARGDTDALHGQLAIGWSVVQDLATVVLVVTLPALTGADPVVPLLLAAAKAAVFLALSYVIGVRLLPRLFDAVARLGSSELFLLVVFGTALGAALVSNLVFGLSLALGAFVAGLIVSESDISYQSAAEIVPFRDLFAVLFFVSVGMLVDPRALAQSAPAIVGLVLVVGLGKAAIAAAIAAGFGIPTRSAILAGAALGHAGEFTFLLAGAALALGILEAPEYNLVLATTVVSIVLASPLYDLAERAVWALEARRPVPAADAEPANPVVPEAARPRGGHPVGRRLRSADGPLDRPHVVVLGGGRVGLLVARALITRGFTCVVVERDRRRLEELERIGALTIYGDAANPTILRAAIGPATRLVVVTLADHLASRLAIERIRRINPRVEIVARVRGRDDIRELRELGVGRFVEPNAEAGIELARTALQRLGVSTQELALITQGLRSESYRG